MTWFYKHPSGDAYYNDVEESACAWLRELMIAGQIAPGVVDNRSILDVQPTDLIGFTQCHFFAGIGGWSLALRLAGWPDHRPVWTGSPPCQPFSVAGEGKGKDDERHLAPKFISLVRACRPGVLFGEQVASSAVFGKAAKGRRGAPASAPDWAWIDDLSDRLEAARYATWAVDFPSAGVGAPHIRQRTYFGAVDALRMANAHVGRQCGDNRGGGTGVAEEACGGMLCPDGAVSLGGMADHHGDGCDQGRERVSATGHDGVERDGSAGGVGNPGRARGEARVPEPSQREKREPEVPNNGMRGLSGPDAGRSHSGGLADCASGGRGEERQDGGGGVGGDSAQGQPAGLGAGGGDFGVADADGTTGRENARGTPCDENAHGAAGRNRCEPDTDHRSASDGENIGVAGPWRSFAEWFGACWNDCDGNCTCGNRDDAPAGWFWDADEGWIDIVAFLNLQRRAANRPAKLDTVRTSTPNSFWSGADWLFCRDGKWRPVEPGTFPLAHGVPGRVGLLRGYGNAINPQQAAVFIEESAQALAEAGPFRVTYEMAIDSLEVFG